MTWWVIFVIKTITMTFAIIYYIKKLKSYEINGINDENYIKEYGITIKIINNY